MLDQLKKMKSAGQGNKPDPYSLDEVILHSACEMSSPFPSPTTTSPFTEPFDVIPVRFSTKTKMYDNNDFWMYNIIMYIYDTAESVFCSIYVAAQPLPLLRRRYKLENYIKQFNLKKWSVIFRYITLVSKVFLLRGNV